MIRAAMLTAAVALLPGNSAPAQVHPAAIQLGAVDVRFEGLRSAKGMVRACLTANPKFFPHCEKDPASYKASVAAAPGAQLRFSGVKPGDYALTVLHDENENFRADMMLGIPREGVGFSRNPVLRFSPPSFDAARFKVAGVEVEQDIKLKYFL